MNIKPANILIAYDGWLKLAGFEYATYIDPRLKQAGFNSVTYHDVFDPERSTGLHFYTPLARFIPGTIPYMAPEQLVIPVSGGYKSDVYSFGVVLFQMLYAGQLPYPETRYRDPNDYNRQERRCINILRRARGLPWVNSPLASIIYRCLEFDEHLRPEFRGIGDELVMLQKYLSRAQQR